MNKEKAHEIDSIVEGDKKPIVEELNLPDIIVATDPHDIDVNKKPPIKNGIKEKPIRRKKEDLRSYIKRLNKYIIYLQNLLNKNK